MVQHVFPLDAEYEFRIGRAGGGLFGLPPVGTDDPVEVTLNGERVRVLDRKRARPVRLKIPAGPQTIGVAVVRRANARGVDDLFSELAEHRRRHEPRHQRPAESDRAWRHAEPPQDLLSCRSGGPRDARRRRARGDPVDARDAAFRRPVSENDPPSTR